MRQSRRPRRPRHFDRKFFPNRLLATQVVIAGLFLVMVFRLFQLQIVRGEEYYEKAIAQRTSSISIPARRGEILVRDRNTGDLIKLATNTTLDLVYIDPLVTPDKRLIADTLAPILYTDDDYKECLETPKLCPEGSVDFTEPVSNEQGETVQPKITPPTRDKAVKAYADVIFRKINRDKVDFMTLASEVTDEALDKVDALHLSGIGIIREKSLVYTDPTKVPQNLKARQEIAKALNEILNIPVDTLVKKMELKDLRYVQLKNKIRPELSDKIKELKEISNLSHEKSRQEIVAKKLDKEQEPTPDYFRGVVLIPEHWRYYPDNQLASQVIGYVNREGKGQYGIEGQFDRQLAGHDGLVESHNDVNRSGVDPVKIQDAEDGVNVVLTIDRVIQKHVEDVLIPAIQSFHADSGQVIVMEPDTGRILAMANAPTFNPNDFGNALLIKRTTPEDARTIYKTTPIFTKDKHGRFNSATFDDFEQAWKLHFDPEFYIYSNRVGPGSFINRTIQQIYEPGSVFKPLVMSIAIETGEVTPNTTFNEDGPVKIGDFLIKTSLNKYRGIQTMTNILETSSNVGMVFVAFKLGKSVMYSFLTDRYGFGQYTDVNLAEEEPGTVKPKIEWSDALQATTGFGQGITVTPLQMARAWCALANGGMLVQPMIVDEKIWPNGKKEVVKPQQLRRVISPDASTTMTNMLISSVDVGVAHRAHIPGYTVAGKTGTSQIAGKNGKYEIGEGAYVTSFAGYAPANDPKYLILVKFDRPRMGTNSTWGENTAAPVFQEIMSFLLDYGNIQPDRPVPVK